VPFTGSNGPQILFRILSDEAEPPTFVDETLPAALDPVLMKGLKKKPDERFQSVGAFADALGHAFGLDGDHTRWATMTHAQLSETLPSSKAPPPMPADPKPSQPPPPVTRPSDKPVGRTPEEIAALSKPDEVDAASIVRPSPPVPIGVIVAVGVVVLLVVAYLATR
jgi:serine/threonine-protein kinase